MSKLTSTRSAIWQSAGGHGVPPLPKPSHLLTHNTSQNSTSHKSLSQELCFLGLSRSFAPTSANRLTPVIKAQQKQKPLTKTKR